VPENFPAEGMIEGDYLDRCVIGERGMEILGPAVDDHCEGIVGELLAD